MTTVELALPRLKVEEGFRAHVYKDSRGLDTIGYGFCIAAGISEFAASALLIAQATERHNHLMSFAWYAALDPVRQSVCLDVDFNANLLHFPHMIAALAIKDWETAAVECKVTNPELASRYAVLAKLLLTGDI